MCLQKIFFANNFGIFCNQFRIFCRLEVVFFAALTKIEKHSLSSPKRSTRRQEHDVKAANASKFNARVLHIIDRVAKNND